jgi:hypothetical protein
MFLTDHQSGHWEAIEEAMLLHELHTQHGFSQNSLANKTGRDQSWVSRRLSLLKQLPDSILHAIIQGNISIWSATRILAPMARAIPTHAELLLQHTLKEPLSTRELRYFYEHYQHSNHQQRSKMVNDPNLFFKAQELLSAEKQAKVLQAGPEGKWNSQLRFVRHALMSLLPLISKIFTPYQDKQEQTDLIHVFNETKIQFDLLTKNIRNFTDAHERHAPDDYQSSPERTQLPRYQPTAESLTKHRAGSDI